MFSPPTSAPPPPELSGASTVAVKDGPRPRTIVSKRERAPQESRARRLQRYEAVTELYQRGISMRAIERQYGIGRETVSRWARAGSFPERAPRVKRPSMLDPCRPCLEQRWA